MANLVEWIRKHRKHIVEVGSGATLYAIFNGLYDFVFYPFAMTYFGLGLGAAIAAGGSLLQCAIMFWLYDAMKIDWLMANAVRKLSEKENANRIERMLAWIGSDKRTIREKLAGVTLFVSLNSVLDPLVVAIYFRQRHFNGVTGRDWLILLSSVLIANALWLAKVVWVAIGLRIALFGHI